MLRRLPLTKLRKNYDAASDRFATSSSEVSVGCEASSWTRLRARLAWADAQRDGSTRRRQRRRQQDGLAAPLDQRRERRPGPRTQLLSTATRSAPPRESEHETRGFVLSVTRDAGVRRRITAREHLLDAVGPRSSPHRCITQTTSQHEEVYEWGSISSTSQDVRGGITCSAATNLMAARSRAGHRPMQRCHATAKLQCPATHHHHRLNSAGSQCVSCSTCRPRSTW